MVLLVYSKACEPTNKEEAIILKKVLCIIESDKLLADCIRLITTDNKQNKSYLYYRNVQINLYLLYNSEGLFLTSLFSVSLSDNT